MSTTNTNEVAFPVAVVDLESASKVGEIYSVVQRFQTPWEAEDWIDRHEDQNKVERGGFAIDVPEDMQSLPRP